MSWQDDPIVNPGQSPHPETMAGLQAERRDLAASFPGNAPAPAWQNDPVVAAPTAGPRSEVGYVDANDMRARGLGRAPIKATPQEIERAIMNTGPSARATQGVGDVFYGAAQLGSRALSPFTDAPARYMDRMVNERAAALDRERRIARQVSANAPLSQQGADAARGWVDAFGTPVITDPSTLSNYDPGIDIPRAIGNAAATTAAIPMKAAPAATWLGRAAQGAKIGGAGAAVQPIADTDNFALEKAKQVGIGTAIGGVAPPVLEGVVRSAAAGIRTLFRPGAAQTPAQADNIIAQALEVQGIRWKDLAESVKESLRQDVKNALQAGAVDPQQLGRLADIRAVGATPTRGAVTLDPVQITKERNLAKLGAASDDPQLRELAQVEAANNRALIERANTLGAGRTDEFQAGARAIAALKERDELAKRSVTRLYDEAKLLGGGDIPLDTKGRISPLFKELDDAGKLDSLPANVTKKLNQLQSGEAQLTVGRAESLKTTISEEIRKAERAGDGNAVYALRQAYKVIDDAEPTTGVAKNAVEAYRRARTAHRARMDMLEGSPALKAASEGAEPDKFFRDHIIGGAPTVASIAALRKHIAGNPEALETVRQQIVNHLKTKALNQATDEVGTFSQSAYNKALNQIGDRKLAAFFSPEEIAQLKQVGRAASYLQVQPKGSAVNNSNTAAAAINMLGNIAEGSGIPFANKAATTGNALMKQRQVKGETRNALRNVLPLPHAGNEVSPELLRLLAPAGGALGITASD